MYIDKYKKEDGFYDENDCYYETAEDLIQIGLFGFCGCGMPEENLKYIRDGLKHIDRKQPDDRKEFDKWYENWIKEGEKIFGNEQSRYFFFYWCDKKELTEHGGSVPGWLSEKGHEILSDLNEILSEPEANAGLEG